MIGRKPTFRPPASNPHETCVIAKAPDLRGQVRRFGVFQIQ